MEKKLFVNEFLQVETSPQKQKAIVNRIAGMLEIAFLDPVATDAKIDMVWVANKWCKENFADYALFRRASLPHAETCILANKGLCKPIFKNCLTSTQQSDLNGRVCSWDTIDEKGICRNIPLTEKGNIYAAIIVSEEYFLKINPNVDLKEYTFSKEFVAL